MEKVWIKVRESFKMFPKSLRRDAGRHRPVVCQSPGNHARDFL